MKVRLGFSPNCSEYTLNVIGCTSELYQKIKEMQDKLDEDQKWRNDMELKLNRPEMFEKGSIHLSQEYKDWSKANKKVLDEYEKESEKRSDELREKYMTPEGSVMDTTIRNISISDGMIKIDGYLNEDGLVRWLKDNGAIKVFRGEEV